jgi:SatD family (SatD)
MVVQMLAVVTIDQRSSRGALLNRADEWAADLNERFAKELIRPFVTTTGDEIQGVTKTPNTIVEILLGGIQERAWWLGVGIGDVETPLQQTAARSRGPAFYNARDAVEAAKRSHHGFVVLAENDRLSSDIQTVLELLAFLIRRRGHDPMRWRAVELAQEGRSTVEIGKAFDITQQAASKRLLNAGFYEEVQGRELAERLFREALGLKNAR